MPCTHPLPLAGWRIVVLRPAATRAALLRAVRGTGAVPVALPALRLAQAEDTQRAAAQLNAALCAPLVLFTSPAAVAHARALPSWRALPPPRLIALGPGTAAALARIGAPPAHVPARSDSEGLLALPVLEQAAPRQSVGLVTAPGGRDLIAAELRQRGIDVVRADVYRRLPPRFGSRHRQAVAELLAGTDRLALLVTSQEALGNFLDGLAPHAQQLLQRAWVVAASERLAAEARRRGATTVLRAAAATPAALLSALSAQVGGDAIR